MVIEDYPCIDSFNKSEVLVCQLPAFSSSFAAAHYLEDPVDHDSLHVLAFAVDEVALEVGA